MSAIRDIDAQFHRAVDIVQSLPKGGPIQTSYEEKLWLYSLYKQGTEGDITIPRPGMLDLLGKAKWDSWNKQKGIDKTEAKRLYVNALVKILKKYGDQENVKGFLDELESFSGISQSRGTLPDRPVSPASSSSSYHSSQASPPLSPPRSSMLPPDPNLPPPDVAPEIIPPSALTSSHRSLLALAQSPVLVEPSYGETPILNTHPNSRAHSLAGGRVGSTDGNYGTTTGRKDSVHSFRTRAPFGYYDNQQRAPPSRAFSPQLPAVRDFVGTTGGAGGGSHPPTYLTPDMNPSPYLGFNQSTPIYPPRPASASTFSHHPPPTINLPQTLQQIQISLTALHERLSTLERTQAMILRKEERKRTWFWSSADEEDLDQIEDEAERSRWGSATNTATTTVTRVKRKKGKLSARVLWFLFKAVRRAMIDVGMGFLVVLVGVIVLGGGWRRTRFTLSRLRTRFQKFITDGVA
ncbi:hypothetical protein CI109_102958 [Kwoniella shandongensis]|uniref:Uncharacterized protein n=1 Tax=Kwoniella shandongensis TaxID=1734106 RepID=A0A5M6C835_9TREE|nr:uncharacterized protein CI109_000146 [Kwoniella shandongensis]KAA5531306.1 hypothetical protein CI109_000146 [Kwoniella shandongensis]